MFKKAFLSILFVLSLFYFIGRDYRVEAQVSTNPTTNPYAVTPPLCGCPPDLNKIYTDKGGGERCVTDIAAFQANPTNTHLWVEDSEVTAQGKANDRARQFIYWVMTHSAIDNHPVLFRIWGTTRNIAYFFTILSAALFGLAIIIGQRTNFATGVKIWPSITKVLLGLLYISFSATVVVTVVQLSGILMKFFVENLGGADLFNIYFSGVSQEANYLNFVGCRDLNIRVQEAVKTEMWILKATNFSYYLMGGALLLRTIVLWFLLFVAPFLAILLYFGVAKNTGMVWIGVFFQWVFYGPLLALFLGSMATIWKNGIPFLFDFSRVDTAAGYIYPTAINILYGGPAQKLSASNNGNYVDTFVEYIITLIMLWAVTIFPWFLLRTFRDYCCDGINAIKNMMLSSLNNFKPGPTPPTQPVAPAQSQTFGTAMDMKATREATTEIHRKIETVEEIKKARTEEIVQALDLKASNITQIANFETNKTVNQNVTKNINYLKNPTQAMSANDRLRYMNIRSEISTRASHADPVARSVMNSFLFSRPQQVEQRKTIINTLPKAVSMTNVISVKVQLPQAKVESVSNSVFDYGATNKDLAAAIAAKTQVAPEKVQEVLTLLKNSKEPPTKVATKITEQAKMEQAKVKEVIKEFSNTVATDTKVAEEIAKKQNLDAAEVKKVVAAQMPIIAEPEKHIEAVTPVSPLVSIEEYEQVKKMWVDHYEKGEIPVAENIRSRSAWVEQDIVLITNTLNKLLSEDQLLKEQALDEVGFIMPIFMVNSLSGEQLVTYLKAKVEAAKQVQELQQKEKEITERLKAEGDKVEVSLPKKKEAAKTMTMSEELKEVK
ncbi:MAG: hypothetical protein ACOYUB_04710 [Patescibacteria group bacterium]